MDGGSLRPPPTARLRLPCRPARLTPVAATRPPPATPPITRVSRSCSACTRDAWRWGGRPPPPPPPPPSWQAARLWVGRPLKDHPRRASVVGPPGRAPAGTPTRPRMPPLRHEYGLEGPWPRRQRDGLVGTAVGTCPPSNDRCLSTSGHRRRRAAIRGHDASVRLGNGRLRSSDGRTSASHREPTRQRSLPSAPATCRRGCAPRACPPRAIFTAPSRWCGRRAAAV